MSRREGKFEMAQGGTLFLDEVGNMPAIARQSSCGPFKSERSSCRRQGNGYSGCAIAGGDEPGPHRQCRHGSFSRDSFYRLSEFTIHIRLEGTQEGYYSPVQNLPESDEPGIEQEKSEAFRIRLSKLWSVIPGRECAPLRSACAGRTAG